MKVLLTAEEFEPSGGAGIATYIRVLGTALVRAGAEVHVLSVSPGRPLRTTELDGLHVHEVPLVRPRGVGRVLRVHETWHRATLALTVARAVDRLGFVPDVVECPEFGAEPWLLVRRHRTPVVVRLHGASHHVFPYIGPVGLDKRMAIRLEDASIARADVVLAPPAHLVVETSRLGLEAEATRAIPLPVLIPDVVERPPPSPGRIAFFGRLERRKGVSTLIQALPRVRASIPVAHLVIVGPDTIDHGLSVAGQLRRLAAVLGVEDSVDIRDHWIAPAEVAAEMDRSMVCAVPSLWESFGYVAAEASARGRAVVASDVPGLRDVLDDGRTGLLARPDDVGAWVNALTHVLGEPERAETMGKAARALIATRFDPDDVAAQTLEAYELARRRHRERQTR